MPGRSSSSRSPTELFVVTDAFLDVSYLTPAGAWNPAFGFQGLVANGSLYRLVPVFEVVVGTGGSMFGIGQSNGNFSYPLTYSVARVKPDAFLDTAFGLRSGVADTGVVLSFPIAGIIPLPDGGVAVKFGPYNYAGPRYSPGGIARLGADGSIVPLTGEFVGLSGAVGEGELVWATEADGSLVVATPLTVYRLYSDLCCRQCFNLRGKHEEVFALGPQPSGRLVVAARRTRGRKPTIVLYGYR